MTLREDVRDKSTQTLMIGGITKQHGSTEPVHRLPLQVIRDLGQAEAERLVYLAEGAVPQCGVAFGKPAQHEHTGVGHQDGCGFSQPAVGVVRPRLLVISQQDVQEELIGGSGLVHE